MASMMTSWILLMAVVLAAMFLGTNGKSGDLPLSQLKTRCQKAPGAVFAHPGHCQLYYNCSHSAVPSLYSLFSLYMQECPYPQQFSTLASRCQDYHHVRCGNRREHFDQCGYRRYRCTRSHCYPCRYRYPSCEGLPDGMNARRGREWTPFYVVCGSQRPVSTSQCPRHPTLSITQFFHPKKRRCVSLYEIPRLHSGYLLNCTKKADGLHMDDVTHRPNVYYHCHGGQLMDVQICQKGKYFDEETITCAKHPRRNSIMSIP
ncbi:hypothetical protein ACOMHN_061183 [Nucella lapillus]